MWGRIEFKRLLSVCLAAACLALLWPVAPAAKARAFTSGRAQYVNWYTSYWNNTTLSGPPDYYRQETSLDYDWQNASPAPGINANTFSARWAGYVQLPASTYRFTALNDNGLRVWVNGSLLIDQWQSGALRSSSAEQALEAGRHLIVVDYYQEGGSGRVQLVWEELSSGTESWQASYWNNVTLTGPPALERSEPTLNYDWGNSSPDEQVGSDNFSARWVRFVDLADGAYRFVITSDDGARLWVDGELLLDEWYDHPVQTASAIKRLSGGRHWLAVEYFETTGSAVIRVGWEKTAALTASWRAEYYDNPSLSGEPQVVRDDSAIDFDWGSGSPAPGYVRVDRFSARWTRALEIEPGLYRFTMVVDDGGRLWVNGQILIDAWKSQEAQTYVANVELRGGSAYVQMEYFENTGKASAHLSWTRLAALAPQENKQGR